MRSLLTSPGPVGLLTPRLALMLIITHLVQLVKRLNVVDQACQLSAGRPEHTVVHVNGHALNGGKQALKRRSLPHKRSAGGPHMTPGYGFLGKERRAHK